MVQFCQKKKRHWLPDWIQEKNPFLGYIKETCLHIKKILYIRAKMDIPFKWTQEVNKCDHFNIWKVVLKAKLIRRDNKEHYIHVNGKKKQEKEIVNQIFVEQTKKLKYVKNTITDTIRYCLSHGDSG